MSTRYIIAFVTSLVLAIGATFLLTRAYYDVPPAPVVRFSRRLDIQIGRDTTTINSPFRDDEKIKKEISSRLSTRVQQYPQTAEFPGIYLDTSLWVCKNGKSRGMNHTGVFFLRKVGEESFQFWDRRQRQGIPDEWFPREGHLAGSIQSCVDYYWQGPLSDLIRDHTLDWEAEHPDFQESWEKESPDDRVSFRQRLRDWKDIFLEAWSG